MVGDCMKPPPGAGDSAQVPRDDVSAAIVLIRRMKVRVWRNELLGRPRIMLLVEFVQAILTQWRVRHRDAALRVVIDVVDEPIAESRVARAEEHSIRRA